jgi:endonuclease III
VPTSQKTKPRSTKTASNKLSTTASNQPAKADLLTKSAKAPKPAKAGKTAAQGLAKSHLIRHVIPRPKTIAERKTRIQVILDDLDLMYPNVTCALHHTNAWELLVATILSAQCTDKRVNLVTPVLFRKYPTIQDFANASQAELAADIRTTGFFNNKSKSVIGAARKVLGDFGGEIPRDIEQLLTVPGAARKTANVVLGTAFGIPSGVVVDTHVQRLSLRLDLTRETHPVKIEQDLMKIIPQERWILFSHQMIHHGRALCVARNPKCAECQLEPVCYAPDKTV